MPSKSKRKYIYVRGVISFYFIKQILSTDVACVLTANLGTNCNLLLVLSPQRSNLADLFTEFLLPQVISQSST